MDVGFARGRMPAVATGAAAVGGLAGWGCAAAGLPWLGALPLLAGMATGAVLLLRHASADRAVTLFDLYEVVSRDPDHPQASLLREVHGMVQRVDSRGQAIREVVRKLQEHATLVAWVIDTLNQATGAARESLDTMQAAMVQVHDHAGNVLDSSQQGVQFLGAMAESTENLFSSAEILNQSVEDSTSSILQIHGALAGVEQGVALLSEASDRSTEFVTQVGQAMGQVRERLDSSLDLAQKAEAHARQGKDIVAKVGTGVERIRDFAQTMAQSIQALGKQSREIEGVLGIITDVAEETGLLSLNAAILAAQAGEKGAAFAVVADQIRSLARRTRDSTKHIEELIRGVQSNISEANLGLTDNIAAIEEGRALGREAVAQLEAIDGAVVESVEQARQIARSVQEQDEKAHAMVNSAGEVNENLHQVADNLGQSLREMDRIQALTQSLAALSQSVRAAAEEHRQTGWKTSQVMGSFATQVEGIHGLVDSQGATRAKLQEAVAQIGDSSGTTKESLATIHAIVNELVQQADGLREEMAELWSGGNGASGGPADG